MLPKRASAGETEMGQMMKRPMLQDLLKAAMVESAQRVQINEEARLQSEKTAEEKCGGCGMAKHAGPCSEKKASETKLSGQHVEKLASALDFIADVLQKEGAHMAGPHNLTEHLQTAPPGVMEARSSTPLPDKKGEGVHTVPMHPGEQKGLKTEHGATQLENTLDHAPQLHKEQMKTNYGKQASAVGLIREKLAKDEKKPSLVHRAGEAVGHHGDKWLAASGALHGAALGALLAGGGTLRRAAGALGGTALGGAGGYVAGQFGQGVSHGMAHAHPGTYKEGSADLVAHFVDHVKQAEDAINPAHISAGAAVAPETSEAGQPGGEPVGGAPQGPSHLVASAESAMNYTKGQAYANRKDDLKKYFDEPALKAEHDRVLQDAFENTGKAGPKIASAAPAESVKTAAARVLLSQLAQGIEAEGR